MNLKRRAIIADGKTVGYLVGHSGFDPVKKKYFYTISIISLPSDVQTDQSDTNEFDYIIEKILLSAKLGKAIDF